MDKLTNNFNVCVRKRPLVKKDEDIIKTSLSDIYVMDKKFSFDNVFSEYTSTQTIYSNNIKKYIINNKNFICYTFGETGSGKTFTLFGNFGIVELALRDLTSIHKHVTVSVFEIYNNNLYDLLNLTSVKNSPKVKINMFEKNGNIIIKGLNYHICDSYNITDIIKLINVSRATGKSSENNKSSRSHVIFKIYAGEHNYTFVDIAGSERAIKSICTDKKGYYEMADINRDIFALKECIRHMTLKSKRIPFRSTKITMALRDSFYNDYNNLIIITVSPEKSNINETLNILSYANELKNMKQLYKINNIISEPSSKNPFSNNIKQINLNDSSKEHIKNPFSNVIPEKLCNISINNDDDILIKTKKIKLREYYVCKEYFNLSDNEKKSMVILFGYKMYKLIMEQINLFSNKDSNFLDKIDKE